MELNRIGLGWAGTQMVRQSNGAASKGQGSNSSQPTLFIKSRENPSKCYCLVCCAYTDFLQLPKALLRLLISLPLSERSHWKRKQQENGKSGRQLSGRIHVTAKELNVQLLLEYRAPEIETNNIQLPYAPEQARQSFLISPDVLLRWTWVNTYINTDKNLLMKSLSSQELFKNIWKALENLLDFYCKKCSCSDIYICALWKLCVLAGMHTCINACVWIDTGVFA